MSNSICEIVLTRTSLIVVVPITLLTTTIVAIMPWVMAKIYITVATGTKITIIAQAMHLISTTHPICPQHMNSYRKNCPCRLIDTTHLRSHLSQRLLIVKRPQMSQGLTHKGKVDYTLTPPLLLPLAPVVT